MSSKKKSKQNDSLSSTKPRAVSKKNTDNAVNACAELFAPEGRFSQALPDFSPREAQLTLAKAISRSIQEHSILVAEAGTGTGKTFAYLTPCLLSGKKVLISTATKTLQDQLNEKDIPLLTQALGLGVRVQNLKGRGNYICHYRVHQHAEEGRFTEAYLAHEIANIRKKLPRLKQGERGELPEVKEDSPLWPYVTSTADNCLGATCEYHQKCFLVKARKRALSADVVVINHHLFFADACLKDEGLGELLPKMGVVVFDEAHQLTEIATHFFGDRLSTNHLKALLDDLFAEWPVVGEVKKRISLKQHPLAPLKTAWDNWIADLLPLIPETEERLPWQVLSRQSQFQTQWQQLLDWFKATQEAIEEAGLEEHAGLQRCLERLKQLEVIAARLNAPEQSRYIRWVERYKHSFVFHATPIDVAATFSALLAQQTACAFIFTSATLTVAGSFQAFTKPLGLEQATTLLLPSPFDFKTQSLLYLPRDMPDPYDGEYYDVMLQKVLPIIERCGGRTFFLFTSHRALRSVAQRLNHTLQYPLLVQGDEAKPLLLARFRQLGNAVLLGTATFWEGVDVKGEALSCVIIDKLPFASPGDPVVQGKMAYIKSQGLSAFDEMTLPDAVLALKQGVGRLIRDVTDKGILIIPDPRLITRHYGRQIFNSLPMMPKTRTEAKVLQFIDSWKSSELISD